MAQVNSEIVLLLFRTHRARHQDSTRNRGEQHQDEGEDERNAQRTDGGRAAENQHEVIHAEVDFRHQITEPRNQCARQTSRRQQTNLLHARDEVAAPAQPRRSSSSWSQPCQ